MLACIRNILYIIHFIMPEISELYMYYMFCNVPFFQLQLPWTFINQVWLLSYNLFETLDHELL